jgi:hypothetical protein
MMRIISALQTLHDITIRTGLIIVSRTGYGTGIPLDSWEQGTILTTDDALIKSLKRHEDKITPGVHNPVRWLMEVTMDGSKDAE